MAGKFAVNSGYTLGGILVIVSFIPIVKLVRRKQFLHLPLNVKISFVAMVIYAFYMFTSKLLIFLEFDWFFYIFTKVGRLRFSIFLLMFLLIHWEFTTHYL